MTELLAELTALLEERIGLDAESIGASAVERAVRQRLAACHMSDYRAYWSHVRSSEAELQELVESIVVPETWFFRDREALIALGRLAAEAGARRPGTTLRLLSLPCSTGEEPYSMAMALLDAGLGIENFQVDGVDISARALALARRGIYGRNSFRGSDLEFRDRYFEPGPNGHHLIRRVRECVRFRQDNLLSLDLPRPANGYDFIFCRNVLIYFAAPAQHHALRALHDLLASAGLVFVGPAETSLMVRHGYVSAKIPLTFAFRQASGARQAPVPEPVSPAAGPPQARTARRPLPTRAAAPARPRAAIETESTPRWTLPEVKRLADEGRLDEAAAACETLLRDAGGVEAYYLGGVVHGALGHEARAMELYRKALYLDPLHADALMHLAYLLETRGDLAGADVLRNRARRALERRQG